MNDSDERTYFCMYTGTTSRWGLNEPDNYYSDTHIAEIIETSRGRARAKFAKLYHLDFMDKISVRVNACNPGE